jgi:acyl dehydratase
MARILDFDAVAVGDSLPPLSKPPIDRVQLALFAGASGDHNPIHLDDDAARGAGLPGVIAHGMLNMAFLGQLVTGWAPRGGLRSFAARFTAMAYPGDTITCRGTVVDKAVIDGRKTVELDIVAENQSGERTLAGHASIVFA